MSTTALKRQHLERIIVRLAVAGILPVAVAEWLAGRIDNRKFARYLNQFIFEQMQLDTREASRLVDCATEVLDEVRRHD